MSDSRSGPLTIKQTIEEFDGDTRWEGFLDDLADIIKARGGPAMMDQMIAAGADLASRIEKTKPYLPEAGLHGHDFSPNAKARALLGLLPALGAIQRGVELCPHASPLENSPQPIYMLLSIKKAMCAPCMRRYFARGKVRVLTDDGLCDYCQAETAMFWPVGIQIGYVYFAAELCDECHEGMEMLTG